MAQQMLNGLRSLNRFVAVGVGLLFLACAALVLGDIIMRRLGTSLGGTDEISGYVMAIGTAWGMAFALLELSHVRIDFLRSRAAARGRALLDLLSMLVMAGTVSIIAVQCWPVVATTLKNSSTANTPLETPLAWVQIPWFMGWAWFALMAWLTFIAAGMLIWNGRFEESEKAIGVFPEFEPLEAAPDEGAR